MVLREPTDDGHPGRSGDLYVAVVGVAKKDEPEAITQKARQPLASGRDRLNRRHRLAQAQHREVGALDNRTRSGRRREPTSVDHGGVPASAHGVRQAAAESGEVGRHLDRIRRADQRISSCWQRLHVTLELEPSGFVP
jgi:hypothetical protein